MKSKKIVIIGGGLSGLVSACYLKYKLPCSNVIIIEKNNTLGGRLFRKNIKSGDIKATINNGPSWYWMPDLIEKVYKEIGINDSYIEKYNLKKLDPQYKIITNINYVKINQNIPGNFRKLKELILAIENKSVFNFTGFLKNASKFYDSLYSILRFPNISFLEYFSFSIINNLYILFSLNFLGSYRNLINTLVENPFLRVLFEWPSLFIGSSPNNVSSMFSFLTYSMIYQGTYVPDKKGMYEIIEYLEKYARYLGVQIYINCDVKNVTLAENNIQKILVEDKNGNMVPVFADYFINSSDYRFFENLLPPQNKTYPEEYWNKQVICPSCLIFNIILDTKLKKLEFHNLFFDKDLDKHINTIYNTDLFPGEPLFYLNITTKLFDEISDKSCENLFILVPTNPHKILNDYAKNYIFDNVIKRISEQAGINIENHIVYRNEFCDSNFGQMFNAFGNNAYGLSCDKLQIGIFRPLIKPLYVENLYYCGQMTSPGPGVPPSMISGLNAVDLLIKDIKTNKKIKRKEKFKKRWFKKVCRLINTSLIFVSTLGIQNISTVIGCIEKEIKYVF